ncbi:tetratricopeptide repeat protein [Corallococcus terminator]
MFFLVLALLTAAPDARTPSAPDAREEAAALRRSATKAYRARDYKQACPLFEKAVALLGSDSGLASDLGLCFLRQGRKAEARRVLEDAVLLAGKDNKARHAALFNLGLLGEDLAPREGCAALTPARGCDKPVQVCAVNYSVLGLREDWKGRAAALHSDSAKASAEAKELKETVDACASGEDPFKCMSGVLADKTVLELSLEDVNTASANETTLLRGCRVLYANACLGQLFAACADPGNNKPKEVIVERAVP